MILPHNEDFFVFDYTIYNLRLNYDYLPSYQVFNAAWKLKSKHLEFVIFVIFGIEK